MTTYDCECEHEKSQHRGGTYGCRALDCGCARYTPDIQAAADEHQGKGEVDLVLDMPPWPNPKQAPVPTEHALSTSALLARAEQERDAVGVKLVQALRERLEVRGERDLARAELAAARQEIELLRRQLADAKTAADEKVRAVLAAPAAEVIGTPQTRYLCESCGARYGVAYTDHPCGRLTPVTVTTTRVSS